LFCTWSAQGTPWAWWTTISTGIGADPDADKHFQFVMRPELLQALREMNW
jgi:hypothetical protein